MFKECNEYTRGNLIHSLIRQEANDYRFAGKYQFFMDWIKIIKTRRRNRI